MFTFEFGNYVIGWFNVIAVFSSFVCLFVGLLFSLCRLSKLNITEFNSFYFVFCFFLLFCFHFLTMTHLYYYQYILLFLNFKSVHNCLSVLFYFFQMLFSILLLILFFFSFSFNLSKTFYFHLICFSLCLYSKFVISHMTDTIVSVNCALLVPLNLR